MEYADYLRDLSLADPGLARVLAGCSSLEHVLAWAAGAGMSLEGLDVIAQDEFCHDLLLPLPGGRTLALGLT